MPKKKFINKKTDNAITFSLVHRSQRDPLAADDSAPQHLLHPINHDPDTPIPEEFLAKAKEEEREYDINFDDDYNYMQHLKDKTVVEHDWDEANEFLARAKESKDAKPGPMGVSFNLPKEVFASKEEDDTGLLNRAARSSGPLLDWDPDIVETLDDEFKHEVVLTLKDEEAEDGGDDGGDELDDLFAMAKEEPEDGQGYYDDYEDDDGQFSSNFGSEAGDDVHSLDGRFSFTEEETKSKFTQYSMSSSVIRRNEQLSTLDDRFEKFMDGYMEENTGGLDMDEIEGVKDESSELMKRMLVEYKREVATERQQIDNEKIKTLGALMESDEEGEGRQEFDRIEVKEPEKQWDCESIISTYSNIYHRPKFISETSKKNPIVFSGKHRLPKDAFARGLTASALKELDMENEEEREDDAYTIGSRVSQLSIRNKHETLEEKRARKLAFREFKKERRIEKKANTTAFKEEKARQEKNDLNNRRNVQGRKIV